jgi:hypothetical protein
MTANRFGLLIGLTNTTNNSTAVTRTAVLNCILSLWHFRPAYHGRRALQATECNVSWSHLKAHFKLLGRSWR